MALPNDYTYNLSQVYDELQQSGSTFYSGSCCMTRFNVSAPTSGFDPSYVNNRCCLRNYRNYSLICEYDLSVNPSFINKDSSNNIWVTHFDNNSVSKITTGGTVTNYTGTGLQPSGIVSDGINMWTANRGGQSVTKITPTGSMTTYSLAANSYANTIGFDGTNLWTYGNCIAKITTGGIVTNYPSPSNFGANGNIVYDGTYMWATDNFNFYTRIASDGTTTTFDAGSTVAGQRSPTGIIFDGTYKFAAHMASGGMTRISGSGGFLYHDFIYSQSGAGNAYGIALGDFNTLWISDGATNSQYQVGSGGVYFRKVQMPTTLGIRNVRVGGRLWIPDAQNAKIYSLAIDGL